MSENEFELMCEAVYWRCWLDAELGYGRHGSGPWTVSNVLDVVDEIAGGLGDGVVAVPDRRRVVAAVRERRSVECNR